MDSYLIEILNKTVKEGFKELRRAMTFGMALGLFIYADMNHYYIIEGMCVIEIVGQFLLTFLEALAADKANQEKKNAQ